MGNAFPHLVQGICGRRFPTPFARPPGVGLSAAWVNVVWADINIAVGFAFLAGGRFSFHERGPLLATFGGLIAIGLILSFGFAGNDKAGAQISKSA